MNVFDPLPLKDYREWFAYHLDATGAAPSVATVFEKNHALFAQKFRATGDELVDATQEILFSGKIPKFANEHLEAVIREVRRASEERAVKARPDAADDEYTRPSNCACGGTGLVAVPHPTCVWNGKIVSVNGRVATAAVMCDAAGCPAGRRVREDEASRPAKEKNDRGSRPTATEFERRHGIKGAAKKLREYEREGAERARRKDGLGPDAELFARLMAKVEQAEGRRRAG